MLTSSSSVRDGDSKSELATETIQLVPSTIQKTKSHNSSFLQENVTDDGEMIVFLLMLLLVTKLNYSEVNETKLLYCATLHSRQNISEWIV